MLGPSGSLLLFLCGLPLDYWAFYSFSQCVLGNNRMVWEWESPGPFLQLGQTQPKAESVLKSASVGPG